MVNTGLHMHIPVSEYKLSCTEECDNII